MSHHMIVINLVNQAWTAAYPIIAKDILWRFQFPPNFLEIGMQKWKQKQHHKEG